MKVLCVGQNYAKHVRELGGAAPEAPVWFWKPDSAIVADGAAIELPAGIGAVHHEVELAVRVGRPARRTNATQALGHLDALTVANDVTARDLQAAAKKAGKPWAQAKGYDTFLPLGAWQSLDAAPDLQALRLRLTVNGQARQDGRTADMTWPVAQLVALASQWTTLHPGDVLLTGTPDGVGPLADGDVVEAEIGPASSGPALARLRNPVRAVA